jgi:hypothetical protein
MVNKDPAVITFGQGSVTMAYRPVEFAGRLTVERIRFALSFGPDTAVGGGGTKIRPLPDACLAPAHLPPTCPKPLPADLRDGMPEVELFDRTGSGSWHRLPHLTAGRSYDLTDAGRYADPASGSLLVRFVNARQEPLAVNMNVSIEGTVK